MSPGRGWNDRLREQSDSEDDRNDPSGVGPPQPHFTPLSVSDNTSAATGTHHKSSSSTGAAAAAAAAIAAGSHPNHRHSFFGGAPPQDIHEIDVLGPDQVAALQRNNSGAPPAAAKAGNKRRMSTLHGR